MPSLLHEALVTLFRNRPTLAPELLRDALHHQLPAFDDVEIHEANLSQITPTEYHADLVVLLKSDVPVFGTIVEVQLSTDPDKRFSWPLYALALRAKLRCPTCVLVVTPDARVARWAAQPIDTGQPASPFIPLVVGPDRVPRVSDLALARQAPELAVLSAQAHGAGQHAFEIAWAAVQAARGLDDERSVLYFDLVLEAINETARRQLEELMLPRNYEFQSDFAKRYIKEGKAEGKAEGEARGRAHSLLRIMAVRGLDLSAEQRAMVEQCTDLQLLDTWVDRAVKAETVGEVFNC